MRRATEFLTHGDKVRLLLAFRGREMAHPELGMAVLNRFIEGLAEISTTDGAPKRLGKLVSTTLTVKPQYRVAKQSAKAEKEPLPEARADKDAPAAADKED